MKKRKIQAPRNKEKGFTFTETMVVVAIVALLVAAILISINQSRKNARLKSAKNSLRSVLPAIIACKDSDGNVNIPAGAETGVTGVCNPISGFSGAYWPRLANGYRYMSGGTYNSNNCDFQVSTNGDSANITCSCVSQICQ